MILECHHISKSFNEIPVLKDVAFRIEKGEKVALVGINGAGKTTLLKIILGKLEADSGAVSIVKDLSVGYLAQNQNVDSENTIYEELLHTMQPLIDMEKRIEEMEAQMGSLHDEALTAHMETYTHLLDRFKMADGYAYKGEVNGVLTGLGFNGPMKDQKIATLSGGQKTRVALGKLLLQKPDLIILDEPTNHLDISSIRWLENYLISYKGAVLIVSHDRYFLDRIVTKVVELDNCASSVFKGNYSDYAEKKKKLREDQLKKYLSNQAEIKHQEAVIEKLRQFNREKSIKRAESREKMLNRIEVVEKPREVNDEMRIHLTPCIQSGKDVLAVEDLSMGFGDNTLFENISFEIKRGEHVALIGDNGTGKTTLLRLLNGALMQRNGTIRTGVNVHIGYYDQEHHVLNEKNTILEEIADAYPSMTNTQIRNVAASFLFTGEDVFKQISTLSGGEKGRVSLAKLMLSEANFLILDEPTNHLDIVSKEVLENALNSYEGTVFYVSHDRYFINHTASRILSLTHEVILDYPGGNDAPAPDCYIGNYDFYLQKSAEVEENLLKLQGVSSAPAAGPTKTEKEPGGVSWAAQKEDKARQRKKENDLRKCEEAIAALEQESSELEAAMALPENCTDISKLNELMNKKAQADAKLEELYEKWEALSEDI